MSDSPEPCVVNPNELAPAFADALARLATGSIHFLAARATGEQAVNAGQRRPEGGDRP